LKSTPCLRALAGSGTRKPKLIQGFPEEADANITHYFILRKTPLGEKAESEYCSLGKDNAERRERIIPFILAEMERRAGLRPAEEKEMVTA
jgi:hypothetical protein